MALHIYALLANGMGGLDWAGLPLVAAWLGVHDVEGLMHRLSTIKTHRARKPADAPEQDA